MDIGFYGSNLFHFFATPFLPGSLSLLSFVQKARKAHLYIDKDIN